MKISFNKPFIAGRELYYIAQAVLVNAHTSGGGPFSNRCHHWLETQLGCTKALLTHSCTGALEMSAILCDIQPGDEVIMPSFTFVSTANAFVLRGGVPVFIDIRRDTLNINEKLIEQAITPRTKAIVPVHYAGRACEMDAIMRIADENSLWVIEDAAQALMSTYREKHLGSVGHIGCLSFHETKNIISGEGGAILLNSEKLIERAEIIWEKGTNRKKFFRGEVDKYTWVDIGSSFLPSEMIAAFLFAQLEHAAEIIERRKELYTRYRAGLKGLDDAARLQMPRDNNCNGHIFYIITRSLDERTSLINYLKENKISSVFHYIPLHTSPAGLRYGRSVGSMTETIEASDRLLRLPLFYEMTNNEVDKIVSVIHRFYQ